MSAALVNLGVVLVKAGILATCALIVVRLTELQNRTAYRVMMLVPVLLLLLPLFELFAPSLVSPMAAMPHAMLATPVQIGGIGVPISLAMIGVYTAGVVVGLIRLTLDWTAANRMAKQAIPIVDDRLHRLIQQSMQMLGVTTKEPLMVFSAHVQSPAVFGWRRPVLLLPIEAAHWSDDELVAVFCHELTHVARRDSATHLIERVIAAFYWPMPLVSSMWHRMSLQREMIADRAALEAGVCPSVYADSLIRIARACTQPTLATSLSFGASGRRDLEHRIDALFSDSTPPGHSRTRRTMTALPMLVVMLILAGIKPVECVSAAAAPTVQRCA